MTVDRERQIRHCAAYDQLRKIDIQSLVSVIIIFYNEENYIGAAIKSVLNQTYDNWELLLVDDGSHDESSSIAMGYARDDPDHIAYHHHSRRENRGMSASRNLGLREAKGGFIAFLDADDVWESDKLKQQMAVFAAHSEVDVICGATLYWYSWTGRLADVDRDYILPIGAPQDQTAHPVVAETAVAAWEGRSTFDV
jgi:glycosyltransferase involved in cell wall biosynthesis